MSEEITLLQRIIKAIEHEHKRAPIDTTTQISSNKPLVIDFQNRRHLFLWSANTLTLSVEDLGTITVATNTWVNIGFQEGQRLVPTSQATLTPIFIRATDEIVP